MAIVLSRQPSVRWLPAGNVCHTVYNSGQSGNKHMANSQIAYLTICLLLSSAAIIHCHPQCHFSDTKMHLKMHILHLEAKKAPNEHCYYFSFCALNFPHVIPTVFSTLFINFTSASPMLALPSLQPLGPPESAFSSRALCLCTQFCDKDFGENLVFLTLPKALGILLTCNVAVWYRPAKETHLQ